MNQQWQAGNDRRMSLAIVTTNGDLRMVSRSNSIKWINENRKILLKQTVFLVHQHFEKNYAKHLSIIMIITNWKIAVQMCKRNVLSQMDGRIRWIGGIRRTENQSELKFTTLFDCSWRAKQPFIICELKSLFLLMKIIDKHASYNYFWFKCEIFIVPPWQLSISVKTNLSSDNFNSDLLGNREFTNLSDTFSLLFIQFNSLF